MQARTLGTIFALFLAALLLVIATWVTATRTVAEAGLAGAPQPVAVVGTDLKENFLSKLRWSAVERTSVDLASIDTTLQEYFLQTVVWGDDVGTADGAP